MRLTLFTIVLALALLGGLLGVSSEREPVRVQPRRNSGYWPAYLVYTFVQKRYTTRDGETGPVRMYFMLPTLDADHGSGGLGNRLMTYSDLLDNYRVSPEQLNRVPLSVPNQWMSEHIDRLRE